MLFKGKKGQLSAASGAGTLIIVIALAIFLYILFLPPETRKALLEENETTTTVSSADLNKTLLLEHPGNLAFISEKSIEKNIPNIKLFSETVPVIIKSSQFVYAKNAWFDNKPFTASFTIEDLDNNNNLLLSANVKKAVGNLIIKINNQVIYNKEIKGGNIEPLKISKDILKNDNTLEISVSGTGIRFWQTNEYQLEELKITSDFMDTSTLESKSTFLVSSTENNNIDTSSLKFFIYCTRNVTKKMDISVNGHNIYSQVPDCDSRVIQPFSSHYLTSGENNVEFMASGGKYTLDRVSVDIELKEPSNPTYYFELTQEQVNKINSNDKDIQFDLTFVDSITKKEADLIFNGHMTSLDTEDSSFERSIRAYIEEGTNSIKIVPRTELEISDLKVIYE